MLTSDYTHEPTGKVDGVEVSVERYYSQLDRGWRVAVNLLDDGTERSLTLDEAATLRDALNKAIERGYALWTEVNG